MGGGNSKKTGAVTLKYTVIVSLSFFYFTQLNCLNLCRGTATFVTITKPAAAWIRSQPQCGGTIITVAGTRRLDSPTQLLSATQPFERRARRCSGSQEIHSQEHRGLRDLRGLSPSCASGTTSDVTSAPPKLDSLDADSSPNFY